MFGGGKHRHGGKHRCGSKGGHGDKCRCGHGHGSGSVPRRGSCQQWKSLAQLPSLPVWWHEQLLHFPFIPSLHGQRKEQTEENPCAHCNII